MFASLTVVPQPPLKSFISLGNLSRPPWSVYRRGQCASLFQPTVVTMIPVHCCKRERFSLNTLSRLGEVTLKDVKAAVDREGSYRYHFKALDPEFGTVKEEVRDQISLCCLMWGRFQFVLHAGLPGWGDYSGLGRKNRGLVRGGLWRRKVAASLLESISLLLFTVLFSAPSDQFRVQMMQLFSAGCSTPRDSTRQRAAETSRDSEMCCRFLGFSAGPPQPG